MLAVSAQRVALAACFQASTVLLGHESTNLTVMADDVNRLKAFTGQRGKAMAGDKGLDDICKGLDDIAAKDLTISLQRT